MRRRGDSREVNWSAANRVAVVLAMTALAVSAGTLGWVAYSYESAQVSITSVNWEVFANGTVTGFLCDNSCTPNVYHTTVGALLTFTPQVFGTTLAHGLTVHAFGVGPGLELISESPTVPVFIPQNNYVTFNVTVEVPTTSGSYAFLGSVFVTY